MRVIALASLVLTSLVGAALAADPHDRSAKERVINMSVTEDGFVPAEIKVKKGEPLKLVVTRKTDKTCAKEIVIKAKNINVALPLDQPVTVRLTPDKAGNLRYACGMDMIAGVLVVSES